MSIISEKNKKGGIGTTSLPFAVAKSVTGFSLLPICFTITEPEVSECKY
jgi:hypothetical protein